MSPHSPIHMSAYVPIDIMLEILRNLDYRSLLRCCSVCRTWRDIINTYAELQYLIELGADGMVDGSSPHLSYPERLRMLLDRRKRWANLDWKKRSIVSMPGACQAYELVGGVFAKTTEGRHFIASWLPTAEDDGRHILRNDLGLVARDFAIDPTQDLIIFVEDDDDRPDSSDSQRIVRLHLCSIETNKPHPDARLAVISFHLPPTDGIPNFIRSAFIQIVDDVVGMFVSTELLGSRILIWNWKDSTLWVDHTGDNIPPRASDFSFLSSRAYMLTSSEDQGSIYIFSFDPSSTPPSSNHIATLLLPEIATHSEIYNLSTHTAPFYARCPPNKAFTTSPDSRIHVMSLQYSINRRLHSSYCLFVHNHTFLAYVSAHLVDENWAVSTVPWDAWGTQNTRFLMRQVPFYWLRYVEGQRVVCPPLVLNIQHDTMQVLDFNVHSSRTHHSADSDHVISKITNSPSHISAGIIFKNTVTTHLPYHVTSRSIMERYSAFMIDEERILGLKSDGIADEDIKDIHVFAF